MIFHLPYAFHAKRMYVEQFISEIQSKGAWERMQQKYQIPHWDEHAFSDQKSRDKAYAAFLKNVSESAPYRHFVQKKLEKAQRASQETGNLYTASIFLALMSTLAVDEAVKSPLDRKRFGFIAYGSGSKAKVFEGTLQPGWEKIVQHFKVFEKLEARLEIDYEQYEALHAGAKKTSVFSEKGRLGLTQIGQDGVTLGARYYAPQE
jgi:hydroxymethylglutaryl-CoA synthase